MATAGAGVWERLLRAHTRSADPVVWTLRHATSGVAGTTATYASNPSVTGGEHHRKRLRRDHGDGALRKTTGQASRALGSTTIPAASTRSLSAASVQLDFGSVAFAPSVPRI